MTPREIAIQLLAYSGITSLNPAEEESSLNKRGIVPGDMESVLRTMNAAAQEICGEGPAALTEKTISEVLRPPTQVSVTVTQYSKAIVFPDFEPWMESCTLRIEGDDQDNRLESYSEILSPYMGDSGTKTATVFGDAIPLSSRFLNVIEPVDLRDSRLVIAADSKEFRLMPLQPVPNSAFVVENSAWFDGKRIGKPIVAFPDSEWDEKSAFLPLYLRVNPMPDRAYPIRFKVKLKPKQFTMADIDTGDHTTDPQTVIPQDWNESILFPVALQRWTSHPSYNGSEAQLREIARQYTQAINQLQKLQPRTSSSKARYI